MTLFLDLVVGALKNEKRLRLTGKNTTGSSPISLMKQAISANDEGFNQVLGSVVICNSSNLTLTDTSAKLATVRSSLNYYILINQYKPLYLSYFLSVNPDERVSSAFAKTNMLF
jgi:hypothetical protein